MAFIPDLNLKPSTAFSFSSAIVCPTYLISRLILRKTLSIIVRTFIMGHFLACVPLFVLTSANILPLPYNSSILCLTYTAFSLLSPLLRIPFPCRSHHPSLD